MLLPTPRLACLTTWLLANFQIESTYSIEDAALNHPLRCDLSRDGNAESVHHLSGVGHP